MTGEKEILLRDWNLLDDAAVVKSAATKGKFINSCIKFLAERRSCTLQAAKKYFFTQVITYVERLLSNRQIFKADHVLTNVGFSSRNVFFEISKQSDEANLREFLEEYFKENFLDFDTIFMHLEEEWFLFNNLKVHLDTLIARFNNTVNEFSLSFFDQFCKLERELKQRMVVYTFFATKDLTLTTHLDKMNFLGYLIEKKDSTQLKIWVSGLTTQDADPFQATLEILYACWDLDQDMLDLLQEKLFYTDSILYGFARKGCFLRNEFSDVRKVLHRIITTQALKQNDALIRRNDMQEQLFGIICEENLSQVIPYGIFTRDFLETVRGNAKMGAEVQAYLQIESIFDKDLTVEKLLSISRELSKYLSENKECLDHSDFLENVLSNVGIEETKTSIPGNFLHMRKFLNEAFVEPPSVDILYLIRRYLNVDIEDIQKTTFDPDNNYLPTFNLKHEQEHEIYPNKLSYLHYIKQQRSSFALYVFIVDQLRQCGKISRTHILIAAENVIELAMTNITDELLTVHCIAFIECLGIDTMRLRALIRCLRRISHADKDHVATGSLNLQGVVEGVFQKILSQPIDRHVVDLEAVKLITSCRSSLFMDHLIPVLSKENWYKLLLISQYLNLSTEQLKIVVQNIPNKTVRNNLALAISFDKSDGRRHSRNYRRWKRTTSRQKSDNTDQSKFMAEFFDKNMDLMELILNIPNVEPHLETFEDFIQHLLTPKSVDFISYAWVKNWPICVFLAAAKYDSINQNYLWLLWLMLSIDFDRHQLYKYQTFNELSADVIRFAMGHGFTETFSICTKVFYPNSAFAFFAQFLEMSRNNLRLTEAIDLLKKYLLVLNSDNFSPIQFDQRAEALAFSAKIILLHIQHNFSTPYDRLYLLDHLCDIGHFDGHVNFTLMRDIYRILDGTGIEVRPTLFQRNTQVELIDAEFETIWNQLKEFQFYGKAIQVAKCFNLSVSTIILDAWRNEFTVGTLNTVKCEQEIEKYGLRHEILLKFYYSLATAQPDGDRSRYIWLKHTLEVMQKYSLDQLDWIDLDRVEAQLVLAYVKLENTQDVPIHHSAYHQQTMVHENFLLYSTLPELQTIAGLEEILVNRTEFSKPEQAKLSELLNILLDKSDIVQAMRYQQMFEHKTLDLQHVIFSMELAEDITPLYRVPLEERRALMNFHGKRKHSKRTLLAANYSLTPSPPSRMNYLDTSDTSGYDFEEIPSREKQDIKEILQNLCIKVKHGTQICNRIVQLYRASMYMDQPYIQVLKRKDPFSLLNDVINADCLNKLAVIDDLIAAAKMTPEEIASFMSNQLAEAIIKSRFYLFQSGPPINLKVHLWGFDLDSQFHLFLELCNPNNTLFGNYLLHYCDGLNIYRQPSIYTDRKNPRLNLVITNIKCTLQDKILSQKKQNSIQIELLIKAHQCFLHDCSVEGIADVLQKAKALVNVLANAKSWNLVIRLLAGIGKYKEMFYCFDILLSNEQFMPLIRKCTEDKNKPLQSAVMLYLREHCPDNKHYFETAAAYFCLYSDLGELYREYADRIIETLVQNSTKNVTLSTKSDKDPSHITYIRGNKDTLTSLQSAIEYYSSAAELYLLDNKLTSAQTVTGKAEVVALQVCLINQVHGKYGSICILAVESDPKLAAYLVNLHLSVPQAMILSRGTGINIEWARAIYEQHVIRDNENYFNEFLDRYSFTEAMMDDIHKMYMLESKSMITMKTEKAMMRLLSHHHTVADKYNLRKK